MSKFEELYERALAAAKPPRQNKPWTLRYHLTFHPDPTYTIDMLFPRKPTTEEAVAFVKDEIDEDVVVVDVVSSR